MNAVAVTPETRIVCTPHPVTLEGQTNTIAKMLPGEKLGPFLRRTVDGWADDAWEVRVSGVLIAVELLDLVRTKSGVLIEVRSVVKKQALYIVALIALTYFTFGLGAGVGGAWGAAGGLAGSIGGIGGALIATAVYMGGPSLGKKAIA